MSAWEPALEQQAPRAIIEDRVFQQPCSNTPGIDASGVPNKQTNKETSVLLHLPHQDRFEVVKVFAPCIVAAVILPIRCVVDGLRRQVSDPEHVPAVRDES